MQVVWEIAKGTVSQSFSIILRLTTVVLPLMLVIELLREAQLMEKVTDKLAPVAKLMGLPGEGMLGVVVGVLGGLSYGAGVTYEILRDLKLTRAQVNVMFIFLGICHGLIEETVIYFASGVNGLIVLFSRVFWAVLLVALYRLFIKLTDRGLAA